MIDAKRIEEIKARIEAATPGPWTMEQAANFDYELIAADVRDDGDTEPMLVCVLTDEPIEGHEGCSLGEESRSANWELCAHARQDLPDLIAAYEELQSENATLKSWEAKHEGLMSAQGKTIASLQAEIERLRNQLNDVMCQRDTAFRTIYGDVDKLLAARAPKPEGL